MSILTANSQGVINGHFHVPPNIVAGTKKVEFIGGGGSRGEATYTGTNILITETKFKNITTVIHCDPLAQTFMMPSRTMVSAVDLWFAALGTSDIVVQIRNTNDGVPGQDVLAEVRLPSSSCNTSTYTRFELDYPIIIEADIEYAIVVQCNDAVSSLKIATLGQYDTEHNKWVTSQPYTIGVLLSSSNASTWTPHQISDLAFRLLAPVFTETQKTVNLGHIDATGITDIMVLADVFLPTHDCFVDFTLTFSGTGATETCGVNQAVQLSAAYTGEVGIVANLRGTTSFAPVLGDGVAVATGVMDTSGVYISRLFDANNTGSNAQTADILIDALLPGTSSMNVYIRTSADTVWTEVTSPTTRLLDNGFTEYTYHKASISEASTRIKIQMDGTVAYRPKAQKLRCAMT